MSRKAPEPEKPENHERWIVTYADMVTLLFATFVVLWAMSDVNQTKLEQVRTSIDRAFNTGVLKGSLGSSPVFDGSSGLAPSVAEARENALLIIKDRFAKFEDGTGTGGGQIQVRSDDRTITVSLSDNLLFDSGSAELRPGSQAVLHELALTMAELPYRVRVEGHTDDVPPTGSPYADNLALSFARAETVVRYLVDVEGVDPRRLEPVALGEWHPVASNDTPEGRALNRRADIVFLFDGDAAVAPGDTSVPDPEGLAPEEEE
ncbi:MAG: OmpA family protein [Dehalococcoidia bacterium]